MDFAYTWDNENSKKWKSTSNENTSTCIPCKKINDRSPGNPGSFEDLHRRVKNLYPHNFEGGRLKIKKRLSNHFDVSHTINLSSITPTGYQFGAKYIGIKNIGAYERYPILSGILMPNGNLTANFVHTFGCRLRFKFAGQISDNKFQANSSSLEYRTDDFTLALTLANPNVLGQHGTVVLHYLQSITNRFTFGAEIACHRGSIIPEDQQTIMNLAFRYSTGLSTTSATIGVAGLQICYHKKISQHLQLGAELETNIRNHDSVGAFVCQVDLPYADMRFRSIINSETSVGGVFEKRLTPYSNSSLFISGFLNHKQQNFRVGVGLNIGL